MAYRYGLIGKTLGHSHSPAIHALLAPYDYALYELPEQALAAFIRQGDIGGLNVTIPYKQTVLPLCDALSEQAQRIGSVNTLVYDDARRITGHNTDYAGFSKMAACAGIAFAGQKVVILGSGGTSRTTLQVVRDEGAREAVVISRTGTETYATLDRHADADILVNTTPVGMYPHLADAPVSLDLFPRLCGVIDVIYNPLRTRLLLAAQARGLPYTNGLSMLVYQAAEAASLFLGEPIAQEKADEALEAIRASVENIVLIGMPGCGKSSIGQALSDQTGRTLIDTDQEIVRRAGKPIPAIFADDGEDAFRALEREVIAEAARHSGVIIATGGGSILREENTLSLRQNGRLYYLRRPTSQLAVGGRPLSTDVEALARVRLPLYEAACDTIIENNGPREAVAAAIWEAFV